MQKNTVKTLAKLLSFLFFLMIPNLGFAQEQSLPKGLVEMEV